MNLYTQKQTVYKLLVKDYKSGAKGINSVYIRNTYNIVDVATRMFDNKEEFKKLGLVFDKRFEKNGTATYFLKKDGIYASNKTQALERFTQPQKRTTWEKYTTADGYEVMREVSI